MPDRIVDSIDTKTGNAVALAIGERLRARVPPEASKLPARLQLLMDRLREQDTLGRMSSSAPPSRIPSTL